MNALLKVSAEITKHRSLTLIVTAGRERENITELIAALILRSPLFIVAASEWLPDFALTRHLRSKTLQIKQTTDRLRVARSSTCYRLLDILASLRPNGEPILVLDFLHTFFDPDVPLPVRFRVLRQCCGHLQHLALYRPVILMTQERSVDDYEKFYPILCAIADETLHIESDFERVLQPALF